MADRMNDEYVINDYEDLKQKVIEVFIEGAPSCCNFIEGSEKRELLTTHSNPLDLLDTIKAKLLRQEEIIKEFEKNE